MQTRQEYNANNQLTAQHWTVGSTTYSETYTYSKTEGTLSGYNNALGESITLNYDSLRRLSSVTGGKYTRTYTYRDVSTTNTTSQVSSLTYSGLSNAPSFGYSYDVLGNIATYNQNGTTYTYAYDAQNQLLSQTGGGKTYSYTYDAAGNILTASDGTTSHSYTYGHAAWKDLLTAFDNQPISYDASGNPTSYYNGMRWTMTWQEGRRLASATNGTTSLSYTYDSEGLRLTKTVGTTVHTYLYAGGKLIREDIHRSGTHTDTLDFIYDHAGHPYALKHTTGGVTTTYYYITNLQGDVLSLVTASGTPVAAYTYDPYGNPLTATGTLANINPLRYRSYVYDTETGLYYVSSRYYDPEIGRFINADSAYDTNQGILGHNMYTYCLNNPVNMYDPDGRCSKFLWWKIDCKQASCPDSKNYVKPKAIDPIGSYNKGQGYVYVVAEDQLTDVMKDKEDNVVIIVDYRTASDPNMRIMESYKITKTKQQKEIAQLMLDYNTSNPVDPAWCRTLDSLVKEWEIHNTVYSTGFYRSNTADCDFNNGDEGKGYWDFFVERVLK